MSVLYIVVPLAIGFWPAPLAVGGTSTPCHPLASRPPTGGSR